MRKLLLLMIAVPLLATTTAPAGEPVAARKTGLRKESATQKRSEAPKLFRETILMTQAFAPPPAPAVDGTSTTPTTVMEPVPMDLPMSSGAIQLYDCVKYEDLDNVHPCAVTKIVAVPDPCQSDCDCCGPRCVYVQICVPPCGCPEIKTHHGGRKIKYDYGKYEIEIKSKKDGVIEVDYDKGLFNHF